MRSRLDVLTFSLLEGVLVYATQRGVRRKSGGSAADKYLLYVVRRK